MRCNVDGLLRQASRSAGGTFEATLPELAENLRELHDRWRSGDADAALREFFGIYVFDSHRAQPARRRVRGEGE